MFAYSLFAALILAVLISSAILVVSYRRKREHLDYSESSDSEHPEAENTEDGDELTQQKILQSVRGILQKFVNKDEEENGAILLIRDKDNTSQILIGKASTLLQTVVTSVKGKDDDLVKTIIHGATFLTL